MKVPPAERPRPLQELSVEHPGLDRRFIGTLVREFYRRVRTDERLGPIFDGAIGEDWEPHLEKLTDFWSAVILKNGAYNGRPVPAHVKLKQVREEDFDIWLGIFKQTAADLCEQEIAKIFVERAERIAQSLKLAMFFRLPAAGSPGTRK
jgi:hemoglobin